MIETKTKEQTLEECIKFYQDYANDSSPPLIECCSTDIRRLADAAERSIRLEALLKREQEFGEDSDSELIACEKQIQKLTEENDELKKSILSMKNRGVPHG